MRKFGRWLIMIALVAVCLACFTFMFATINRGIILPEETPPAVSGTVGLAGQEALIARRLRAAPWQGLRFLTGQQEWRFYGWTGETQRVQLTVPFDLIRVWYLEADGDLAFTWVATGIEIPGEGYQPAGLSPLMPGQLVAVRLFGKHVSIWGVDWNACGSRYCRLAALADTMIVLDDKGTGVTNGFIRYGWEPPAYPMYGFLSWTMEPVEDPVLPAAMKAK